MNPDGIADVFPSLTSRSNLSEARIIKGEEAAQHPSRLTSPSDEFLLSDAANGSKEAVALLFNRYQRVVWNVARKILRDETEAEDLCQEVFLSVFQKAKLFDATKGTPSSWIMQMTHHRAIDRRRNLTFRKHYNASQLNEELVRGKPHPPFIDVVFARQVLERLRDQLTTDQQRTLELHFFEGYSLREIAETTSQTLGNIRNHYYRGLERLRSIVFPEKDA